MKKTSDSKKSAVKLHTGLIPRSAWQALTLAGGIWLGGCASAPPEILQTETCLFPNSSKTAPDWICTGYHEGLLTGMGHFPASNASYNLRFQTAEQRARVNLARKLEIELDTALKDYENQVGAGNKETIDQVVKNLSSSHQKVSLSGSRVYASVTGPDGSLYVLMGLDEKLALSNMKRLIRSSYGSKDSAWQEAKAQKAFEQLDALLEKRIQP